ncbi:MAG TPA: hypothetical protein VGK58_03680 [Lacipirellulaceae bacterium]
MRIGIQRPILSILSVIVLYTGYSQPTLGASALWGANSGLGASLSVGQIDPITGRVLAYRTIPGEMSRSGVRDFASDPLRNPSVVWSLSSTDPYGDGLLSFDPHRGLVLSNVPLDESLELQGLAIDPTTGHFYATSSDSLYRIDPDNGQATRIGATSLRVDEALAFDLNGYLFGVSRFGSYPADLVLVNKATGQTTKIANLEVRPLDMAVDPDDGEMFGLGFVNDPMTSYSLYRINLGTGAATIIGPSLFRPAGLAFTIIPEPATGALTILAAIALLNFRRVT